MPRQLEIRTTILAKGSRSGGRDANVDADYAAEALQLLDEIQQLKANLVKTDKKVLGTYKKAPAKPKRYQEKPIPAGVTSKKADVYDVVYPAIGEDREPVVSRCVNRGPLLGAPRATFTPAPGLDAGPVERPATPSSANETASSVLEQQELASEKTGQLDVETETREEAERAPADVNSPDEPGENGHASTERLPQQQQQQRHPDTEEPLPVPAEEERAVVEDEPRVEESLAEVEETVEQPAEEERVAERREEEPDERKENRRPNAERSRHYDRSEIRKYMRKQKKERMGKPVDEQFVCHHKRPAPLTRAEIGLPSSVRPRAPLGKPSQAPGVAQARRREEDWGPYEQPNFTQTFAVPERRHETDDEKTRKKERKEKSIQTETLEPGKVDEATQMTARELDGSASNWLYSLPSSRKAVPSENQRSAVSSPSSRSSASGQRDLTESSVSEAPGPVPAPVGHLIAQIETLEHYLGNLLESAVPVAPVPLFDPYSIELPPAVPAKPPPSAYCRPGVQTGTFTLPDGRLPLRASVPRSVPPKEPREKQKTRPKFDETSTSTQYRPLPDHYDEYVRLTHRAPKPTSTPAVKEKKKHAHDDWSCLFPKQQPVKAQEPQQTYFRDFNEILRADPALTEKSNSWRRVPAREKVLAKLGDEIRQTVDRMSQPNTSDSDFMSHLSMSEVSVRSAEERPQDVEARRRALAALTDELRETLSKMPQRSTRHESGFQSKLSDSAASTPKNGPGSRSGARDAAPRTAKSSDRSASSSRRTVIPAGSLPDEVHDLMQPLEETTFLTLTPHTTSFEASAVERKAPFDSTGDAERLHAKEAQPNSSIFSATFSPIPRAVSPLSLVSEPEKSVDEELERKQSTSSSDRSEHDRSVGEKLVDTSQNRRKSPSPRLDQVTNAIKKSDDLLARLRSELMRDESLFRSLQHVSQLEKGVEQQKNLKIQLDSSTRDFFETQSDALKLLMHQLGSSGAAGGFRQGSQAAIEVDRAQKSYSSDFESEIHSESSVRESRKRSKSLDAESPESEDIAPPKAVDLLLQEEAKQQRLLLKLREKARIEKTLAELELLQMQKRILRAQGERDKAASIKKRQRGLLMKLQEERAKIEGLRRQRRKDGRQRANESHSSATTYDTSWETDVTHDSVQPNESDSSTSTLQPVSEDVKGDEMPFEGSAEEKQEEANDSTVSNASNPRLRAPLSPRTTESTIRAKIKCRRRHSSGSDDSINLSQTETTSDVSDVESRLLALTDQLQKRQAEAQRLKLEHRKISKEKLKAQESALLKQIEVYDKCISDLRTQLDGDVAPDASNVSGQLAVRPVIRQPRALIRADEAKSPTSARSESDSRVDLDASKLSEAEEAASSAATDVRADEPAEELAVTETEKSISEVSVDQVAEEQPAVELSDSGRADETMIVKNDSVLHEELAEEIARSILEQLVDETIDVATRCVLEKRKSATVRQSVLQRVSALLSTSNNATEKDNRSQLYLTTAFDVLSPDDAQSPEQDKTFTLNTQSPNAHCDVNSAEGRTALENKLNELRLENEWIDDDLVASPLSTVDISRERVIQEAEELEREQRRIQEEIQRLSAESVLYMREIPNKPPPPYTPPGQALNWQRLKAQPAVEVQRIAPRSKDEVVAYCRRFADFLIDNNFEEIPEELYAVDYSVPHQPAEPRVNCRAFMTFLADLTRHFLRDLMKRASFAPGCVRNDYRAISPREELLTNLEEAVLIQLNQRPRLKREGLLAKWSQRKRDRIDEILVRELQSEEKIWTDFSQEEDLVKRQTADGILEMLLDETAAFVRRFVS